MSETTKPRVRVQAGSSNRQLTADSFTNFAGNLGYGTVNLSSGSTYGFNPVSRNHVLVEWMYRGSWLVRKVVDCPAEDMTRQGIHIESDMPPDRIDALTKYWNELMVWQRLCSTVKWARLYGGSLAVMMIDGQDLASPLRPQTVGKGQFKGLMVLDRWMVWPHLEDLVTDFGADYGLPRYYEIVADARSVPRAKIHHSRCLRFGGAELPYWQKIAENEWDLSVLEPFYDRMIAFDSATQGAAQLIYKAHLRVLKLERYRELIATGGAMYQAVVQQLNLIRLMQSNEGLTVLDATDSFEANQYSFGGLSDMMIQFATQVSGAADIPVTRLFGQSPAGMNSTGDSDLRNYYDGIKSRQEATMRRGVSVLLEISHRSKFGTELPEGFNWTFAPLWQLSEQEKAGIAGQITGAVDQAVAGGLVDQVTALKELRQSSRITGVWSNITDETIKAAEEAAANPPMPGLPGEEEQPGQPPLPAASAESPGALSPPGASGDDAEVGDDAEGHRLVDVTYGGRSPGITHEPGRQLATVTYDRALREVHGLDVVVETARGAQRTGYGWAVSMPSDYGYLLGTSSAEGPREQMDAFVGEHPESELVFVVDQVDPDTKLFDEHKVFLGFQSRDDALDCYREAFSDGRGAERIGSVRSLDVAALKSWLATWPYGRGEDGRPKLRAV